ncbi:anionic cell wall polymer biosynthesis LytR-Cps2A-Psr (LCP) family protein [Streptomyces umbrinus]|uniref:LCP family protein n=1 Tax=Streptomyces umbrinus TaxID=67370 RepID=UPI00167DE04C|nr:LCP family protein [Streptomyces umbrinus]MCR3731730.1 anionic cell wall polymer biosynthesis LytR-Cps2A-Psr (LCP) family protein [Streptomyces umbrinus]GHH38694.1 membrane protein [Streptomyces umbrinus]
MNDRYDAGYGGDQYELVGYDEFGQPVYRQVPSPSQTPHTPGASQAQQEYGSYDPYGGQTQGYGQGQQGHQAYQGQQGHQDHQSQGYGQGYGYDPYAAGQQGQQASPVVSYDTGQQQPVAPYDTGQQQAHAHVAEQTAYIPQQGRPAESPGSHEPSEDGRQGDGRQGDGQQQGERDYRTEQFAFVEEQPEESEDVIDWLKFTENRTERREEAKRRARGRVVALVVVLALVAVGGVGYLWYDGSLPGTSSESASGTTTAGGAQNRDVIIVHLHNTKGGGTATALLVNNTTTKQGTTVLLPNSLALTDDNGTTTTLAKSVDDDGSSGTRDEIDTVLGTDVEGTWRLDTPYLNNLVELVGNIDIDTNADVPDPEAKKKGEAPLVKKGDEQTLSGKMAVAYATYRASGESQNAQLERFGQVMQGVLRKLSSDPQAATTTVQTLAQILDPSLSDKDLGAFLAKLADRAKGGDYKTALLPVQTDGRLSAQASDSVVKDVLGGAAKSPEKGAAVQVGIRNSTGNKDATEQARVVLLNGGYTFVDGGRTDVAQAVSQITYADAAKKEDAVEVAKTLGLPTSSVKKGKTTSNADVSVVLGQDYKVGGSAGSSGG